MIVVVEAIVDMFVRPGSVLRVQFPKRVSLNINFREFYLRSSNVFSLAMPINMSLRNPGFNRIFNDWLRSKDHLSHRRAPLKCSTVG